MNTVLTEVHGDVLLVTINRPEVRNAVDGATARALVEAFREVRCRFVDARCGAYRRGGNVLRGSGS